MSKETKYPNQYRGIPLIWKDNKPKHKKGDKVFIFADEKYQLITLDSVKKEQMHVRWIRGVCWPCRKRDKPIEVGKYVYRWNDGLFTEGAGIDAIETLNRLRKEINELEKDNVELNRRATLYDQLRATLNGEIIDNDN